MERQPISLQDHAARSGNQQPQAQPAAQTAGARSMLLSIGGSGARIDGTFHIADSIDIECEVSGEMIVGGRLVIGENAVVTADVQTLHCVIMGSYSGNLRASGSIEITSSGRVSGNLETNELVVSKGGIFTGNVTRPGDPPRPQARPAEPQAPGAEQGPSPSQPTTPNDAPEAPARQRPPKARPWS